MESSRLTARAALGACHDPHLIRIASLVDLDAGDYDRLKAAMATKATLRIGQELPLGGRPLLLASGWACRVRILADGRRQVFSHLLPGDLVQRRSTTRGESGTITALMPTLVIEAPTADRGDPPSELAAAYAALVVDEDRYLQGQVLRLGRLTATERLIHLFLEFGQRLRRIGAGDTTRFPLPISQEIVADTLGLTTVHINRTLQSLRRAKVMTWEGGYVAMSDPARLAAQVYFDSGPTSSSAVPYVERRIAQQMANA